MSKEHWRRNSVALSQESLSQACTFCHGIPLAEGALQLEKKEEVHQGQKSTGMRRGHVRIDYWTGTKDNLWNASQTLRFLDDEEVTKLFTGPVLVWKSGLRQQKGRWYWRQRETTISGTWWNRQWRNSFPMTRSVITMIESESTNMIPPLLLVQSFSDGRNLCGWCNMFCLVIAITETKFLILHPIILLPLDPTDHEWRCIVFSQRQQWRRIFHQMYPQMSSKLFLLISSCNSECVMSVVDWMSIFLKKKKMMIPSHVTRRHVSFLWLYRKVVSSSLSKSFAKMIYFAFQSLILLWNNSTEAFALTHSVSQLRDWITHLFVCNTWSNT